MTRHTDEEIRELQYWNTRALGVNVEVAIKLVSLLCNLLDIQDPDPIDDPDVIGLDLDLPNSA